MAERDSITGFLKARIAQLDVNSDSYDLAARFRSSFEGVRIASVDTGDYSLASAKRRKVLEIRFRKHIYEQFQNYLSRIVMNDGKVT